MGFSFQETMRGVYLPETEKETKQMIFFEVKVSANSIFRFIKNQMTEITGTVHVGNLASQSVLNGTLEIAIFTRKELVYRFDFESDDGKACQFVGKKHIKYSKLLDTMTSLTGTLYVGAQVFGEGELWFDLKELPRLILSARPYSV
ncbi:hypothetical protein WDW89_20285 [Deltaproteobacteria bacterium TL4]